MNQKYISSLVCQILIIILYHFQLHSLQCSKPGKATRLSSTRQWNNAILLKAQRKNMRHNDTTIFLYVHCPPLSSTC